MIWMTVPLWLADVLLVAWVTRLAYQVGTLKATRPSLTPSSCPERSK